MTPAEFDSWLKARGLSDAEAAKHFGVSRTQIWRNRTGDSKKVQPYLVVICGLIDRVEQLERKSR